MKIQPGSPTVANGVVYADGGDYLYILSAATGEVLKRWPGGGLWSTPVANGVVYTACDGNSLCALYLPSR